MTHLTLNAQLRSESDAQAIENLLRKGWAEAPKPAHNAATQHAPQWVAGAWIVRDKTAAELQAEKEMRIPPITNAQMRKWLNRQKKMDSVKAIINGITDPDAKLDAQVDFEYQTAVRRYAPLTVAVGQALGLTEAQLDAAFEEARNL